ncbi:MAG: dTDP-4-dehydrorhamnose reductase [Thermoanaerobaculia bacterium]|nr:dTDP-4-dehydrorhamnose reductase [Thermoanaerobaculia bacterium]
MRRWLITGAGGMLGTDLQHALAARGEDVAALSKADLDVTDSRAVTAAIKQHQPAVVVNCAGYTKVDDAETNENIANAVNGSAVEFLASAVGRALLVQVSTDFVFDGASRAPYEINERPAPLSAYGRSKLAGEHAAAQAERHLIVRTSWLFGLHGPNFVEAIRNQIRKKTNPLRVVHDQRGRPTYTHHLAEAIIRLVQNEATGIVHYADEPECTWYDFACAIAEEMKSDIRIEPVSTAEFPRPAIRPAYSVLSTARYERITGVAPASWREGLREYLNAEFRIQNSE